MAVRSVLIQKKEEVVAENGVVVAESVEAAEAGMEIFEKGGNAFYAAVATSFASCTCEPAMSSLGGGGAALIYLADADQTVAIEFEGRLPRAATEDMFVPDLLSLGVEPHPSFGWRGTRNNVGWMGYRSLGVPGQVAGLCQILEQFGTMSLEEVTAPAIKICEDGYEVNSYYALMIGSDMKLLQQYPPIDKLLLPGGYPPRSVSAYNRSTVIVQKELAGTLRKIAPEVFGGIQVLQTLNLLEGFDLTGLGRNSPQLLHLIAECFRRAWVDRFRYMGGPEFEDVPIEGLISKEYADEMRKYVNLEGTVPSPIDPPTGCRFHTRCFAKVGSICEEWGDAGRAKDRPGHGTEGP
jgi:gamma-glutamyltranspeptidase/glutathione hydrolase